MPIRSSKRLRRPEGSVATRPGRSTAELEETIRRPAVLPAFCRHNHRFENCAIICMRQREREVLPTR
jgi:hypothetical protein